MKPVATYLPSISPSGGISSPSNRNAAKEEASSPGAGDRNYAVKPF